MKKILGLDLGTTSIGWAYVNEAENADEQSEIVKLGVRVIPLSTDEQTDFEKGNSITINADRTLKRGARRNLDRFQMRRDHLLAMLRENNIISSADALTETGKSTTFETLAYRAKAAYEKIEKDALARVFLAINKKRGYKSSRKAQADEDGTAIDGMGVAKQLYEQAITPGQYCYQLLKEGKKSLPDFYRSDLQAEFDAVWNFQKHFYPEIFTSEFYKQLEGQGMSNTRKRFLAIKKIYTAENKGTFAEKKLQAYKWRSLAASEQLDLSEVAYVITEINNNLSNSSGYLGAISDRSKELYFNKQTVGQYLYKQIEENHHTRLKGQVFYRQDYLDEFEKIWETQKQFHPELTTTLKDEIRDTVIFYQRKLKSQKGLISFCEFESQIKEIAVDGKTKLKTIGARVAPKSSPLFQEFKIWQMLANLEIKNKTTRETFDLDLDTKQLLFDELNIKGNLSKTEVLKLLVDKPGQWELNYTTIEGNRTNEALFDAYQKILILEGNDEFDYKKLTAQEATATVKDMFESLGIDTGIFSFDAQLDGNALIQQPSYQLWHLLYSYEGDNSNSGNELLYKQLEEKFGFKKEYAQILANVSFQDDYGSLSSKAIRKIFPFIKEHGYSEACKLAGYNHSSSLTKEENLNRELKDALALLPKNSLRNPVVEKILNQVVNVVNTILAHPSMGKPDEIRIELARELKKNAKQRKQMTADINKAKTDYEQFRKILQSTFGIHSPSRNDIIRYRLYKELEPNGYKTLYTDTYISPDMLFSKAVDIEHIIPKARLFDDSFSNKTLAIRQVNIDKSDETAYDFINDTYGAEAFAQYKARVESLHSEGHISKPKYLKLLKPGTEIGEGFIERDLRNSQYIAKKARQMLQEICRTVVPTTGSITDRLREDWGLIDTMKELNIDKYRRLGLTETVTNRDGQEKEQIVDWTKRNDHRHHAMDALTVAFTKHSHIQYLNNLNARRNESNKLHSSIIAIERKETSKDEKGKRRFNEPIPNFRIVAKQELEQILISHKAKNKVVTRNKNKVKGSTATQIALTPRGQLHKETVYGASQEYATKQVKIGPAFDHPLIAQVAKQSHREALRLRLEAFGNDPKKAFGGKNSHSKNPVCTADGNPLPEKVQLVQMEQRYTIRKNIDPDLKLDKVVDKGIQQVLRARLQQYGGDAKQAFTDLEKNPIWLNEEKGISIKRVTITGVSNAEPLHYKKDHFGKPLVDATGKKIPADYISTGNNHHVAIYRDEAGNLQEEIVSLFEAVARVNMGMPIIKTEHEKGWQFCFTMKQNEMFIFPSETFDPLEIDLLNPENNHLISPNLFRVQTISVVKYGNSTVRDFKFKHHLETMATENKKAKGFTFHQIKSLEPLENLIKVRLNHLGQIVQIGE